MDRRARMQSGQEVGLEGSEVQAARTRGWRRWPGVSRVALAALAVYGVLLWISRPATPFEWDEVLYQRALDHYDVGLHSPQPPGVPAYVAAAKLLRYLTGDPLLALQVVAIASALVAVALLVRLARVLGAPLPAALAAAGLLAVVPGFLFDANIGLSDVPATAGAIAAVLMCVLAAREERSLPQAAAVVAVALSLRPQIAMVLLPAGLAAVGVTVRRRRWRSLLLAAAAGIGVSALIWGPAVLLTGVDRYIEATVLQARWIASHEVGYRLPELDLRHAVLGWLVDPLGSRAAAAAFWLLAVFGSIAWWRSGRRTLVVTAGLSGGVYLVVAAFTMNFLSAARYGLPALAFFAMLAAGVAAAPSLRSRRTGTAVLVLWGLVSLGWGLPVYLLRLRPAPVWAALTWVKEHYAPGTTLVVYDGVASPHVRYVLERAGYRVEEKSRADLFARELGQPGEQMLFVTPRPVPGCDVVFDRVWHSQRLAQLTFRRYQTCAVSRVRTEAHGDAVFSPEWQMRSDGWQLWGTGRIALPDRAQPAVAKVCAGKSTITVQRPGWAAEEVRPGACVMVPLLPGEAGAVKVAAPPDSAVVIPPIRILPLSSLDAGSGLATAYMVPQAAHLRGIGGAQWRTDLVLFNPQAHPLAVVAQFLATQQDNTRAPAVSGVLAPGQMVNITDVLSLREFMDAGKLGALLIHATSEGKPCQDPQCNFLVLARTYNTTAAPAVWRAGEWMAGVAASSSLAPGQRAVAGGVVNSPAVRASFGMASWSAVPVEVEVVVKDAAGGVVERREVALSPFGQVHAPLRAPVTGGTVSFEITAPGAGVRVVPYVSMVEAESGLPTHTLAEVQPPKHEGAAWREPFPGPLAR